MSGEPGSISFRQQSMAWLLAGRQKATSRYGRVGAAAPTAEGGSQPELCGGFRVRHPVRLVLPYLLCSPPGPRHLSWGTAGLQSSRTAHKLRGPI